MEHPTDRLVEYVRGTAPDGTEIERHLARCARCREELEIVRALAAVPLERLSDGERRFAYSEFRRRRETGTNWLSAAWKVAAAVALVATGVGIWRIADVSSVGGDDWNPSRALAGWEQEVEDLGVGAGVVSLALAYGPERSYANWEELAQLDPEELARLDPEELVGPWEEEER